MLVAVATDLHFGYSQTETRMESLLRKIGKLPRETAALCVCGDTFTLAGQDKWDPLIKRQATDAEQMMLRQVSVDLVESLMPRIEEAVGEREGLRLYLIPGNADALAYQYLTERTPIDSQVQLADGKILGHQERCKIEGLGAITPDCHDAVEINRLNPWYRGVRSSVQFGEALIALAFSGYELFYQSQGPTILMTHMPAYRQVDSFAGANQGSHQVLNYINSTQPLVHLAGHVHDGPFSGDEYRPYSIIGDHTVSLNAGGGPRHDLPTGVRLLTIDLYSLMAARVRKNLATWARDAVREV